MSGWVDALTGFIGAHPHWAGVLVFMVAASEAVVLVGYVIPGTAILLTVGGIVGLGGLPLVPILIWAAAGAVAGDGFSYWLGHTYQESLRRRWPFSRYPDLIDRGEAFFHRHGGKSVLFGRFVPVLKPIIPVVAGILGMPPGKFYLANVVSAVLWSPAHILPGVLVGASLGVLHGISARLVVVVLGGLGLAVVLLWGIRLAVVRLAPVLSRLHRRAYDWASAQPSMLGRRLAKPFDPDHPGTPGLLASLAVLLIAALGLAGVLEDIASHDPLVQADHAISHFLEGLRNPWTDAVMVAVTALGDTSVTLPLVLALLGWLTVVRAWRLTGAVAIGLATAGLAVIGLKALLAVPRPVAMYSGVDASAFPSGHATMATVLFGLSAWLVAGGTGPRGRVLAYTASFGYVLAVALSRVYLGAHWLSDVLGGVFLGALVVAVVAVLYRQVPRHRLRPRGLALVFATVLAFAGTWHVVDTYDAQVARYTPGEMPRTVAAAEWWQIGWRSLPARRVDLAGEQEESLSVQWLGSASSIEACLRRRGWRRPPAWTLANVVGFLKPDTPVAALPTAPALHDGRVPVVLLVHDAETQDARWVFRAWRSGFEAPAGQGQGLPLLVASIVRQDVTHPALMLTLLRVTEPNYVPRPLLDDLGGKLLVREDGRPVRLATDGEAAAKLIESTIGLEPSLCSG